MTWHACISALGWTGWCDQSLVHVRAGRRATQLCFGVRFYERAMRVLLSSLAILITILINCKAASSADYGCTTESCHNNTKVGKIVHDPVLKGNCTVCHDVIVNGSRYGCKKYDKNITAEKARSFCFSCKKVYGSIVYSANYKHEPVEKGQCLQCHLPHSSSYEFLLDGQYYMGEYGKVDRIFSADEFKLCWKCHPVELLTENRTMHNTQFRDGEYNLHYAHNTKNSSVSCRTCHALIHGSIKEKLYGPRYIEHGNLMLSDSFWEYEVTIDGGSCVTPCHQGEEYSRN